MINHCKAALGDLALLYFQDGTTDGSMLMVILWTILLIAYIFAIFAVGNGLAGFYLQPYCCIMSFCSMN